MNKQFYKGLGDYNYNAGGPEWPRSKVGDTGKIIPGFLSNWHIARVYSEPNLTSSETGRIASFIIDTRLIEDRTDEYIRWCDKIGNQEYDISMAYPREWRKDKSIWTVCNSGSGHAGISCYNNASFVYCGIEMPYRIERVYYNQQDWEDDV